MRRRPLLTVRSWLGLLPVLAIMMAGCGNTWTRPPAVEGGSEFEQSADRPPSVNTLHAMSRLLAAQGKDAECESVLKKIITEHYEFLPAYCDLAELQMRGSRTDDAIQTLTAALHVSRRDPVILNNLGVCWITKSDFSLALNMFTQAASVSPSNARYRANMALALGMMGRYDESFALYEQVLPSHEAHYNLAILCRARGDEDRAAHEFGLARLMPASP